MISRKQLGFLALAAACLAAPTAAPAITILDSAWKANGGTEEDKTAGFAPHQALAQEQPFKGAVQIMKEGGAGGYGSGTWIGADDEGRNYILTAAHVVWSDTGPMAADKFQVVVGGTTTYDVEAVQVDPWWLRGFRYDLGILVTGSEANAELQEEGTEPIAYTDQSDEAPTLSCTTPMGMGTIVGFGSAGTGSVGSADDEYIPKGPVAAHNVIDGESIDPDKIAELMPQLADDMAEEAEAGGNKDVDRFQFDARFEGTFMSDFDSEAGDANTLGPIFQSDAKPVDALEGDPQTGDSGGPLWVKLDKGWAIGGVVSVGERRTKEGPDGAYGSIAYFAPLADDSIQWIRQVFPGAKFSDDSGEPCEAGLVVTDFTPGWETGWAKKAIEDIKRDDERPEGNDGSGDDAGDSGDGDAE